ncbi:phosphohistidine phosphatase [Nocardioides ginsengisegetis]|uniref:Phosphohistidine phosphatase n=1 Tax=Nocardioides ginsengisegetis TaxID=661491 RepID=A0A7W3P9I2_9ACTN|nr:histidine phosphatase family protein [Nocardioides ginsengisegetis]MBA8803474.1 phosphohistidine phosphatase [Nocardioides ginsengisegetis]
MTDHTLVLLRHAKSDWSGDEDDRHRPLAARGRRQAPEAGRWLASGVERIDLAVVSPAVRARSTWELAAAELAVPPPVRLEEDVYAASADGLLDVLAGLPEDLATVVLVGHNPGLEDLVEQLTGEWVSLPTSAVAVVDLPGAWADVARVTGVLRATGRPPS